VDKLARLLPKHKQKLPDHRAAEVARGRQA
jgi:ribosome-associated translation inhibitor RaiA